MPFVSKSQIDRHGVSFSQNPKDIKSIEAVQEYRELRLNCLTTSIRILNSAQLPDAVFVSARLKRLDSICRKLTRQGKNFKLAQLEDIVGLRVICQSYQKAQDCAVRISKLPEAYRARDYTKTDAKDTGYRCIHWIMKFAQKFNDELTLSVKFEIQIRSFYQHRWAVWSESHGENTKLGFDEISKKAQEQRRKLQELSHRIAIWEEKNPTAIQHSLAKHASSHHLTVVWTQKNTPSILEGFREDTAGAVDYLNYLENRFPSKRNNALLLVGISSEHEAKQVLRETHPTFVTGQALQPEAWMPKE